MAESAPLQRPEAESHRGVPPSGGGRAGRHPLSWMWSRQLDEYPGRASRFIYLAIVVVATVVLYYELYVGGGAAPLILAHYHMSFSFYVYILVVSNAVGAFSSIVAGLGDRYGRTNLVVYGLLVTGLLTLVAVPNAPNQWAYAVEVSAIGFVEGIILVATPALVRDFSPQLGRASAMGFWTLGPVVGSLVVAVVANQTLGYYHDWESQYVICGIVGLVMFLVAFVGLRELSPALRDQLMVSHRDLALVEARAKGLDIESILRHPWRQMLHADVVGSAFGISVFLLIYYAAVGFFTIYLTANFGFSTAQANGILTWDWAVDAGALIVVGLLSDWSRVRKPFMVAGACGTLAMILVLLFQTAHTRTTGYYTLVWEISLLALFLAMAYAPWMAGFTETVEARNPALMATGLAVWGWIIRIVIAVSFIFLPLAVTSVSPLVDDAPVAAKAQAMLKTDPNLKVVLAHPRLFAQLSRYPPHAIPPSLLKRAVAEVGLPRLEAVAADTRLKGELAYLRSHAAALARVKRAAAATPSQWQLWFEVCAAGVVAFMALIFVMVGRWSPSRARADQEAHDRRVGEELARLRAGG